MWCQYVEKLDGMPKEEESFVDKTLDHAQYCWFNSFNDTKLDNKK